MARRPTPFERDLADLHGDAEVEIIEMQPAEGAARRYRVVSKEKPLMAEYPPFIRFAAGTLGVAASLVMIVVSLIGLGAALWLMWFFLFAI